MWKQILAALFGVVAVFVVWDDFDPGKSYIAYSDTKGIDNPNLEQLKNILLLI